MRPSASRLRFRFRTPADPKPEKRTAASVAARRHTARVQDKLCGPETDKLFRHGVARERLCLQFRQELLNPVPRTNTTRPPPMPSDGPPPPKPKSAICSISGNGLKPENSSGMYFDPLALLLVALLTLGPTAGVHAGFVVHEVPFRRMKTDHVELTLVTTLGPSADVHVTTDEVALVFEPL